MADVFVSYKAEDRRRVRPLVEALQADGFSVWWDEQIGGGAAWRHAIEAELNAAKCVIVAWSKRSVGPEGTFVQDEATRAQQRHVYVPVAIDKAHVPLGFGETQVLSLVGWRGNHSDVRYQAVLAAVRGYVPSDRTRAPSAAAHWSLDRRTAIAGGAVATVAIAGAGGWTLLTRRSAGKSPASIAVLPFANLSGDPKQAYFSDGIAEEIRSALARLGGLTVIGRTSSEAVRDDDARTAARKLRVGSILAGSVRQSASTMRITAELVDGRTGADRWSQDYDRSPGDAIKIQTDIAQKVAQALSAALGATARAAITVGGTQDPQAQKLLLQAVEAASHLRLEGLRRALKLLDASIARDPKYADAYARKAYFLEYYADNFAGSLPEVSQYRMRALQSARTAIRLSPNLPSAHQALSLCYLAALNLADARREALRAVELAPSGAEPMSDYAFFLVRFGHPAEALRLADKALAIDPLNPGSYRTRFQVLYYSRRYAAALEFTKEVEKQSPELFDWPQFAGCAAVFSGDFNEAQRYLQLAPPDNFIRSLCEIDLLIRTGRRAEAQSKLAEFRQLNGDTANYQYAGIYAQLGDADRAFAALNRAWGVRDSGLAWILIDPRFDSIRSDPRYAALLRTMKFPNV